MMVAENFDIKDEELFNQFESFMKAYQDLVDSLNINATNLSPENMEDATQLVDVLNTRYSRIMNNPYLNMNDREGWDEDFDPGTFTAFIQKVVADAESRLQHIVGDDVSVDEMKAAQYAQEFNKQEIEKGGMGMRWTGDKVQQLLEARRNWFKKIMFIKKVGKSHPEYDMFERYISTRRKAYRDIMEDPERKAEYRNKAKARQAKYREKQIEKIKSRNVETAKSVKNLKESGSLKGKIVHLQQKIATLKKDAAGTVKKAAEKDIAYFKPFKDAVTNTKQALDKDPSQANKMAFEAACQKEAEAIAYYLNNHDLTVRVRSDVEVLYSFRNELKAIDDALTKPTEENMAGIQNRISQLVMSGRELISNYETSYRGITATLKEILMVLGSL
jgi:hypothetical protein